MRQGRNVTKLGVVALVAAAGLAAEGVAFAADDREQCATSAEQAQQLRDEGKYRRAREQMLVCARDVCPAPIKSDCGKWLSELERDAPTVVFGARDAKGGDVFDVRVSMDGAVVQERLDGKPIIVDSGEHTFKFETKDGTTKEEKVLLRAAEKARPIIVNFGGSGASVSTGGGGGGGGGSPGGEPREEGSIVPALVVGGIGLAGIGFFAAFGIMGKSDVDDLQKCKPNCPQNDVDSARTKLIVADISLGVGVVGLVVGGIMYFTRPKVDAKVQTGTSLRLDGGPVAGGGVAGIGGTF